MDKGIEKNQIWKQWEQHKAYIGAKNYPKVFDESVSFYEGKQWNDKLNELNIPQVVFNVIKMIIDNKASNVLSTPFAVHFRSSQQSNEKVDLFNRFDKFIWSELNHDLLNRKLVNDGFIKGTFAIHYFWNEDMLGQRGLYRGSIQAEVLDPLFVAVSNPKEKDIQKQKWVMVASRMEVKKARSICQFKDRLELIKPDDELKSLDNEIEQENDIATSMVTVLTKYFRKDGEVYYQQSTQGTILTEPIPQNPLLKVKELKKNSEFEENGEDSEPYGIDEGMAKTQSGEIDENYEDDEKFYLYPIEMGTLTPSDKSIYGLSDVYPIIMAQKMLNVYFSTIYKKSLDDVFPKWIAKKGALQDEITGEPNEVITDYSVGNGWGIQKVEGSQYSNGQLGLADTITEFTKAVSNSRDVLQGDSVGANMSAIAIQSLQAQAEKPIAQQREGFMYSLRKMARIRAQFYKFYYEEKDFAYEMDDIDYEVSLEQNQYDVKAVNRTASATFNGAEFRNTPILIQVDVGRGTKFDAITAQETINNLFLNGNIDKMDSDKLEMYLTLIDDNILPYKDNIKALMRKQRQSEKAQLQLANQQLTQQLEMTVAQLQQSQMYNERLTQEFKTKIDVSNEKLKQTESAYKNANDTLLKLMPLLQGNNQASNKTSSGEVETKPISETQNY